MSVQFAQPSLDGVLMVITDDSHDACGWPDRVVYVAEGPLVERAGCPGCEADLTASTSVRLDAFGALVVESQGSGSGG